MAKPFPVSLDQKTRWWSASNGHATIARMTPLHADNAARWLCKNATTLLAQTELQRDEVSARRMAEILADPEGEMQKTPLYQALLARAAATNKGPLW